MKTFEFLPDGKPLSSILFEAKRLYQSGNAKSKSDALNKLSIERYGISYNKIKPLSKCAAPTLDADVLTLPFEIANIHYCFVLTNDGLHLSPNTFIKWRDKYGEVDISSIALKDINPIVENTKKSIKLSDSLIGWKVTPFEKLEHCVAIEFLNDSLNVNMTYDEYFSKEMSFIPRCAVDIATADLRLLDTEVVKFSEIPFAMLISETIIGLDREFSKLQSQTTSGKFSDNFSPKLFKIWDGSDYKTTLRYNAKEALMDLELASLLSLEIGDSIVIDVQSGTEYGISLLPSNVLDALLRFNTLEKRLSDYSKTDSKMALFTFKLENERVLSTIAQNYYEALSEFMSALLMNDLKITDDYFSNLIVERTKG
ncbi:hypothetical protein [Vibrio sp. D431a]|uniref:hypothetical protein n=1 Tax=Vibrio sp. D431a TaxID=2837388 RepID=UPI002556A00B|nr:hypothetical protein [Vibrio sp. D431a]MDK9789908.1 hypothetical protein [Vibrio sp. D431a]